MCIIWEACEPIGDVYGVYLTVIEMFILMF